MPEPICGACRTRPRQLKAHVNGVPIYYDWCAHCREMAGLDRIAADVHHFRRVMGDEVDDEPVKE